MWDSERTTGSTSKLKHAAFALFQKNQFYHSNWSQNKFPKRAPPVWAKYKTKSPVDNLASKVVMVWGRQSSCHIFLVKISPLYNNKTNKFRFCRRNNRQTDKRNKVLCNIDNIKKYLDFKIKRKQLGVEFRRSIKTIRYSTCL